MRKVAVSRMRERYAQTVLTFRITYVFDNEISETYTSLQIIGTYKDIQGQLKR